LFLLVFFFTIGYGHQSPLSTSGKVFCMVYALIGIPLTMLLLTAVVERLLIPTTVLLKWMNTKLGHLHTPFFIRVLHLIIIVTMVLGFLFLVPAAIFTAIEPSWSYPDALYYCFISLTTIGLGDFIPGDNIGQHLRPLYKACTTIYLLIGVTAMMLTWSVFYSIPEFDVSTLFLLSCGSGVNGNLGNGGNLPTIRASGASSAGDPERIHLHTSGGARYSQHINESDTMSGSGSMDRLQTRRVVRARSRPDEDTPDKDEAPVPGPSGRARLR
jgi:potassium channel subfamily K protein 1